MHWAYAPYFGTGRYDIGDAQDFYALRLAKRWRLRQASLDEDGTRHIGLELRLPVTIGATRNRAAPLSRFFDAGDISTLSAVPGVEIDIPINARVSLKPIVYGGWGTELDGGDSAWIYWGGLRSRISFRAEHFDWALINALLVVGYSSRAEPSETVIPFKTGFEFRKPLAETRLGGDPVYLHWSVAYTRYLDDLEFQIGPTSVPSLDIEDEWELALAFGKGDRGLKLWRLRFDRLGVAYRFSNDRKFKGLGLIFRGLYDR